MTQPIRTLAAALTVVLIACAPDATPALDAGADDGGSPQDDAGGPRDGGTVGDAGTAADAGAAGDAGVRGGDGGAAGRADAGLDDDGGVLPDGGDEAGDQTAPTPVGSVPFRRGFDLVPGATDEDCWLFTLDGPTALSVTTGPAAGGACGPSFDTYLELHDQTFSPDGPFLLADADNVGGDFCAAIAMDVAAGSYAICATSGPNTDLGGVRIDVGETPLPLVDDAPNRVATTTSTRGAAPFLVTFDLDPRNDVDCVRFTTAVAGDLQVTTSDGAGGCPGDTFLDLYSGAAAFIASDDDTGAGLCAAVAVAAPAGEYVACLTAANPEDQPRIEGVQLDVGVVASP